MDGSNHDSSAAVISLEEVAATEDERDELSVVEIPAIEESPSNVLSPANFNDSPILDLRREFATSFSTQNFSWLYELPPQENINPQILSEEILDPSPNPEILSYVPSQQSNRGRRHNSSEEQSQKDDDFVSLWAPAFLSCETLNDLNDVLEHAEGPATDQEKGVRGKEDSAALQHIPKKSRSRGARRPFTLLRWYCTSCGGISQEDIQPIETISAAVPKCEGTLRHLRLVPTIRGPDELP
ncbi:hypothetical protein GHT06_001518 [Daphnia sinensis]|uniref:Uncharacterized protein n=1 Tax=Daphnia sinensis TaxID=1820382 RepID=A0AAD5KUU9_9CRUS|nr:hypothetical protein GHT06_001518 [Daphnia sinensis]